SSAAGVGRPPSAPKRVKAGSAGMVDSARPRCSPCVGEAILETARQYVLGDAGRLSALGQLRLVNTPPEEAFDRLVRIAAGAIHAGTAVLSLLDDQREFIKSSIGLPEPWASSRVIPLSHSFSQHV